jgi:hypothetical protein
MRKGTRPSLARGWQYINRVFTPEGLPYLIGLGVVLIFAGSALFSGVETHAHHHVSLTDGIWWAIGVISTEGSSINASNTAGHMITVASKPSPASWCMSSRGRGVSES